MSSRRATACSTRHDLGLARSADIASRNEFAFRARESCRTTRLVDRRFRCTKSTCCARSSRSPSAPHLGRPLVVPRLGQVLDLARELGVQRGQLIVDVEIKQPDFFAVSGIDVLGALCREIDAHAAAGPHAPVWL
jgi:hypothetical protein